MAYFSAPVDSNPEQEKQPSRGGAASQRPNKRDNAAPQVLPAASAPRIIAVSSAMMRRPSLSRCRRSRGKSSPSAFAANNSVVCAIWAETSASRVLNKPIRRPMPDKRNIGVSAT